MADKLRNEKIKFKCWGNQNEERRRVIKSEWEKDSKSQNNNTKNTHIWFRCSMSDVYENEGKNQYTRKIGWSDFCFYLVRDILRSIRNRIQTHTKWFLVFRLSNAWFAPREAKIWEQTSFYLKNIEKISPVERKKILNRPAIDGIYFIISFSFVLLVSFHRCVDSQRFAYHTLSVNKKW